MTNPFIDQAAHAVSQAIDRLETANQMLPAAQEAVSKIHARIKAQDLARDAVLARRREGDTRTDDAGALTIIADDRAGLADLLPPAEAILASAQDAHDKATALLAEARKELDRVKTVAIFEVAFAQGVEHAEKLEQSLNACVDLARRLRTAGGSGAATDVHQIMARLEASILASIKLGVAISAGHAYHTRPHWKPSELLLQSLRKLDLHEGRFNS